MAVPGKDHLLPSLELLIRSARVDIHAQRFKQGNRWAYKPISKPLSDDDIRRHLEEEPQVGVYVMPAGSESGRLAALDFDDHDGTTPWDQMRDAAIRVAATARRFGLNAWPVRSGGGHGIHLFFRWDKGQLASDVRKLLATILAAEGYRDGTKGVANGEIEIFPKQDRIAEDGYGALIALPFARESTPLNELMVPIDPPVTWISSTPVARRETEEEKEEFFGTVDAESVSAALKAIGNTNLDYEQWIKVGLAIKSALGDAGKALFLEWSALSSKNDARITERKWNSFQPSRIGVGTIYRMAREKGWQGLPNEAPPFSDIWLALRFAAENEGALRYTAQWSRWNVWCGAYWKADNTLRAFDMVREMLQKVAVVANKKRSAIASAKAVSAVTTLVRADRRIAATVDQWDKDPWLLGTPAGTVDLRSGNMTENSRGDYITKVTNAEPAFESTSTLWLDYLHRVTNNDQDLIDYLQCVCGYLLTGSVREEALFFLHGPGGNGKGTFVGTIQHIVGDYGTTVGMGTLMATKNTEHPTEIAKLRGVRLATASETKEGTRWDVAKIKLLTGGDGLTGRFMRGDYFNFDATHKLLVSGNKKPMLGQVDDAIIRRMQLIPFIIKITVPNNTIKERLKGPEAGAILAWCIEGCLRWQRTGLVIPASVRAATDEYLHDMDDIKVWIDDCCELGNMVQEASGRLYASYGKWTERRGAYKVSHREFSQRLQDRSFEQYKSQGVRGFRGLRLLAEESNNVDQVLGVKQRQPGEDEEIPF